MNTETTSPSADEFSDLVNDVTAYVKYKKDEGGKEIEVTAKLPPIDMETASVSPSNPVIPGVPTAANDTAAGLAEIAKEIEKCNNCPLWETRTKTVPGQGSIHPDIMFIGEGPGADEDLKGIAFIGRAGQLLTKIIEAMGYTRDEVFIGNIVKCRPPGNRTPLPHEMQTCMPYLHRQIALLKPKVLVALGGTAAKGLLEIETGITKVRGNWYTYEGIDLMPTYHPAYLLRNSSGKKHVWADMKAVLERLGRKPPPIKK